MSTKFNTLAFIRANSRNLLLTYDGHAALAQILDEAERREKAEAHEEAHEEAIDKAGPVVDVGPG